MNHRMLPVVVALLAGCTEQGGRSAGPAAPGADATSASPTPPASAPATTSQSPQRVRAPAIAGSWYPGEPALVVSEVARLLREASSAPSLPSKPLALVVPHAGWRFSGAAAAAAFRTLHAGDYARVVIIGPSHHVAFDGFSVGDEDAYATPVGKVPVCAEAGGLVDGATVRRIPDADAREHSIEIELPFLQQTLGQFCLVPILAGDTTPSMDQELAGKLAKLNDGKTLYVFSSDFVHYGPGYEYTPYGPTAREAYAQVSRLQDEAVDALENKDAAGFRSLIAKTHATICGRHGLYVLLDLLPMIAPDAHAVALARYASVDLPVGVGPDGVWYVALAYVRGAVQATVPPMGAPKPPEADTVTSPPVDAASGQALVRIARAALRTQLQGTRDLQRELASLPTSPLWDREQAVFVTLNENGRLRGCVGQVVPTYPLADAVVHAALDAALNDTRFQPVTADEVNRLSVEVTALTPSHPIASWKDIVLGRDGIVLALEGHRALFLPQVPGEQGWTLEQTLRELSLKAGLAQDAWRDPRAVYSVFTGQVFEEPKAEKGPSAR